jgi:MYXO-CTERM domain-containing protein
MVRMTMRSRVVDVLSLGLGLGSAVGLLTALEGDALAGGATGAPAYVRAAIGEPWGSDSNVTAMDLAFGVALWDPFQFESVDATTLFSSDYAFVYLDGSDGGAVELDAFMTANQALIESWVTSGGRLFLNSAPNEGGDMDWGFGGVTLHNGQFADSGGAVDPNHPIFNGPFVPVSPDFTGGSYAHAGVSGPGFPLVDDGVGDPELAELVWGEGLVLFGGFTTDNFWQPQPDCHNLRANIIAYVAAGAAGDYDLDDDGFNDFVDNCPEEANPGQEDDDDDELGDVCDPCLGDPINDNDDDTVCTVVDNCPGAANPGQEDVDDDNLGDVCDECPLDDANDNDFDGICGDVDNCPGFNPDQADADEDGIGDACEEVEETSGGETDDTSGGTSTTTDDGEESGTTGDVVDTSDGDEADTTSGGTSVDGTTGDDDGVATLDEGDDIGDDDDASDSSGDGGQDSDDASGCGCTTGDTSTPSWLALALLGVRRRRRT